MRDLVREEVWPIETVFDELGRGGVPARDRAAAGAGEGARPVGRAPAAGARRPGLRPGQARADARDPRHVAVRARGVRQRGAGLAATREILALAGTPDQKERYLHPLLAGDLRSAFSMTEPETAGSDPTLLQTRAVRDGDEWVINGHKWFSTNGCVADFLIVMAVTEPRRAAAPARLDADRAGRHAGREHRPRHPDDGAPGRALRPLRRARRDLLRGRARAGRRAARRRGRGLPDRPAPARPGAHPSLHALARRVAARVRHALRARRLALRVRLDAGREADGPELDRGLAGADAARRG